MNRKSAEKQQIDLSSELHFAERLSSISFRFFGTCPVGFAPRLGITKPRLFPLKVVFCVMCLRGPVEPEYAEHARAPTKGLET